MATRSFPDSGTSAVTASLVLLVVVVCAQLQATVASAGFPSARLLRRSAESVGGAAQASGGSVSLKSRDCPGRTPTDDGYNFTQLLYEDVWVMHGQPCDDQHNNTADQGCSYYFTFCQALPQTLGLHSNCTSASFCKVDDRVQPPTTTNIGEFSTFHYEDRYSLNPLGMFVIAFTVTGTVDRSILSFQCNTSYPWVNTRRQGNISLAEGLIGVVHSGYDSMVDAQFYYSGACDPNHARPGPSSGGLGGGEIFIIVVFVLLVVYLAGGTAFNMLVMKKNGIEALPNYSLWALIFGKLCVCCPNICASGELETGERAPLTGGAGGGGGASGAGAPATYDSVTPSAGAGKGGSYDDL